jgi:hypothetical protein
MTSRDAAPSDSHEAPTRPRRPGARHVPPRWARYTAVVVLLVVGCVAWGVTTAQADLSLGPNQARYEVTTTGLLVVDLGPLGTLQIDSPAPLHLGVDVVVKEIPAELTSVSQSQTLSALGGDLDSYLQFFSTPDRTVHRVLTALAYDALRRTLTALVVVGLCWLGGYALLGAARRRELGRAAAPHTWAITVGAAVVVVALAIPTSGAVDRGDRTPAGSPVFAGTPLAGARITGRLAGLVDTYGEQLVATYRKSSGFYATANQHLAAAYDAWDAAHPSTGDDGLVTLLVISDLHCNTGMSPLIRTAAERSHAQVVLDGGDTTLDGTSVEQVCVDSFASAIPKKVPVVVADGNHDSPLVSAMEQSAGWHVLGGKVITVHGIRILGDRDVLETRIGVPSHPSGRITPDEQAATLATTACDAVRGAGPTTAASSAPTLSPEPSLGSTPSLAPTPATTPTPVPAADQGADLLLIHDPRIGEPTMASGCVPAQVSGHLHRRIDPTQVGLGIRYVNSSTAGATLHQPTVGPLHGTAEMTVLRFDPATRRIADWQLVSVTKTGVATVSDRQPWPVPTGAPVPPKPLGPGD